MKNPSARIRRRDTAVVAIASACVLIVLTITGSLSLSETVLGSLTIFALAFIYHLSVSIALSPEKKLIARPQAKTTRADSTEPLSRAMLDQLPLPVLLIGADGRIERANTAAREFLVLETERGVLSASLRQPAVLEAVERALRGKASEPVEYSVLAPVESHVRALVSPLNVEIDGQFHWQAMLVLTDETPLKRAGRMRADFLANASHELRTPLASLSGFIETLQGHAKNDEEARGRFLMIMQDQTDRMRRLIDDLLALSRVEMDEHVPPDGIEDLAIISSEVLEFLRPQLSQRNMGLTTSIQPDALAVGDRDQMFEVIQNLVENAIKYSPPDSTLHLSVEGDMERHAVERAPNFLPGDIAKMTLAVPDEEAGARYTVLRVRDQGKGISRRDLPRLSERFYRVGGQKSGPKEGTGLGLAIVKHIINRHRGGFAVESAPGTGSVFSVYFPSGKRNQASDPAG
jgi:two-component system phosphate regulon sensor histidine kinase PhoR